MNDMLKTFSNFLLKSGVLAEAGGFLGINGVPLGRGGFLRRCFGLREVGGYMWKHCG